MGPNGVPQLSPAGNGNVQALMLQLRASEDGRMAALMEMQRLRTQLGYDQDLHLDSKMEVDQMTDELNQVRESKRKSEMQVMDMKEKVDLLSNELRTVKRTVTSLKRRLAQYSEDQKRQREQMYAGMNMLTQDQQQIGGGGGSGDGSGNPMSVQNMMHSPRSMVSMVGTMPQLPLGVLRVGNGPGFGMQQGMQGMQGIVNGMQGPSLWQQRQPVRNNLDVSIVPETEGGGGGGGGWA